MYRPIPSILVYLSVCLCLWVNVSAPYICFCISFLPSIFVVTSFSSSICPCFYLCMICPSSRQPICPSVGLSVCRSISLRVYLLIDLPVSSIYLPLGLFIALCQSVCPPICPSVYMHVCVHRCRCTYIYVFVKSGKYRHMSYMTYRDTCTHAFRFMCFCVSEVLLCLRRVFRSLRWGSHNC